VTTTVNGRNIFTTSGRSVALADIPSTLVRRVDVYKTRSPENIARGIAGGIDVQTHRPFDFDGYTFSAQARGIYGEQADEVDPNASFLVSNQWDTSAGKFGALLNVSAAQTNWLDQGVHAGAAVPFRLPSDPNAPLERLFPPQWEAGLEAGLPFAPGSTLADGTPYVLSRDAMFQPHVTGERERPAANLSLQWAPDDKSEYLFEAFYNGYRNDQHNSLFFTFVDWWGAVDPNDPVEIHPGTNVVRSRFVNFPYEFISGDVLEQETNSYLFALGGKWEFGYDLEVASELVYQKSKFEDAFFALRMDKVSPRLFVDFNTGDGVPNVEFFDDPNTAPDESDLTDAGQWNLAQLYDNGQRDKGDALTWTVDADLNVKWGSFYKLSSGLRYDDRGAEENSYFGPRGSGFRGPHGHHPQPLRRAGPGAPRVGDSHDEWPAEQSGGASFRLWLLGGRREGVRERVQHRRNSGRGLRAGGLHDAEGRHLELCRRQDRLPRSDPGDRHGLPGSGDGRHRDGIQQQRRDPSERDAALGHHPRTDGALQLRGDVQSADVPGTESVHPVLRGRHGHRLRHGDGW
jgi:TonB-dependent receptor